MIFTDGEIVRIAEYLGMEPDDFCRLSKIKDNVFERTYSDCPFLDNEDNTCLIQPVKPLFCKQWPYIKLHHRLDKLEESAAKCKGLKITGR